MKGRCSFLSQSLPPGESTLGLECTNIPGQLAHTSAVISNSGGALLNGAYLFSFFFFFLLYLCAGNCSDTPITSNAWWMAH